MADRTLMPFRPPVHQPVAWRPLGASVRRAPDRFYHTKLWQELRLEVLRRDHFRCQIVLPRCEGKASIADHIIEREAGGPDVISNLRACCSSCHNKRHADRWRKRDT